MTALRFLAFVTNGMQLMHPPGAVFAQRGRSVGDSLRAVRSWLFLTPFAPVDHWSWAALKEEVWDAPRGFAMVGGRSQGRPPRR
jgi:hypothetical protein